MSDETKTPKAGEWWIADDGNAADILYIIGTDLQGNIHYQTRYMARYSTPALAGYKHEPRCTGFDWVEPAESWPKYYATVIPSSHYYQIDSSNIAWCISPDEETDSADAKRLMSNPGVWKEVTEAEALARVKPSPEFCLCGGERIMASCETCGGKGGYSDGVSDQWYPCFDCDMPLNPVPGKVVATGTMSWHVTGNCSPDTFKITPVESPEPGWQSGTVHQSVESPDDWVEYDPSRIPRPRIALDWLALKQGESHWGPALDIWSDATWNEQRDNWKIRCRRKDLPVAVPAVKRVPVRLWVHRDSRNDDGYIVFAKISPPQDAELYSEIHSDGNGGWFQE